MATLRDVLQAIFARRLSNPGREFFNAAVESGSWTATIRGSGTAGTYEIAAQHCRYTRIGRRVWADVGIVLAGVVTGGGTGYMQITGIPFSKAADTFPVGGVRMNQVDWAAGAHLALEFENVTETSVLRVSETNDNAANSDMAIAGIAASDGIYGSICYETDDP